MGERGSTEKPFYQKVPQGDGSATKMFMVTVDEGWRSSVVCSDMYGWAASWLVDQLQGKPYAPETRPQPTEETATHVRPTS